MSARYSRQTVPLLLPISIILTIEHLPFTRLPQIEQDKYTKSTNLLFTKILTNSISTKVFVNWCASPICPVGSVLYCNLQEAKDEFTIWRHKIKDDHFYFYSFWYCVSVCYTLTLITTASILAVWGIKKECLHGMLYHLIYQKQQYASITNIKRTYTDTENYICNMNIIPCC